MKKIIIILSALLLLGLTGCTAAAPAIPEPTATPEATETPMPMEEKLGFITLAGETDEALLLNLQEEIIITQNDTELIEKYGLQDASFADDYEMVNGPTGEYICPKDGSVSITLVAYDENGGVIPAQEADVQTLKDLLAEREWGVLASIWINGNTITEIRQNYVP